MSAVPAFKATPAKVVRFSFDKLKKLTFKGNSNKNIVEIFGLFPNRGKGFHVFSDLQKKKYYEIYSIAFTVTLTYLHIISL